MTDLWPLAVGILLAQLTPGPNMLAVSATALGAGRVAGLATAAGVAAGTALWAVLAAFGMGTLIAVAPWLLAWLKLAGGLYLLVVAARALGSAACGAVTSVVADRGRSPTKVLLHGLAVVVTNPKAALLWVSISAWLAGSGLTLGGYALIGLATALSALAVYSGYALLFSTRTAAAVYGRFGRWITVAFGVVFGLLGGRLVLDAAKDLRA